jgi:ectoine hydroxylase-related dioxygenase (phytanoyl-CoA dioxygenase family)
VTLQVLSEQDLAFFDENGYIVVPNVAPPEDLEAVIAATWDFLGMDFLDSATWYPTDRRGAIAYLHQHQSLWNCRQSPKLHAAFADTSKPLPESLGLQGVLALTDTTEEMGGFCCIPGFHKNLAEWIADQPGDRNPRAPDLSRLPNGFKVTPIPMKAGDIVIWNRLLAHGNGRNEGTRPRLAQYITMYPASDDAAARESRVECWRDRHAPAGWEKDIPEKYKGREKGNPPAELSALGRKLLGLDSW